MLAVFTAIAIGNGVYYFGLNIPYQLWVSVLFGLLYLIAVLGFTFFFSSLFKSSSISILVTAILFLFAFMLIQTLVEVLVKIEPWFLITYGAQIVTNTLIDPYPTTSTQGFGPNAFTSYATTIPEGIAILSAYFLVLGLPDRTFLRTPQIRFDLRCSTLNSVQLTSETGTQKRGRWDLVFHGSPRRLLRRCRSCCLHWAVPVPTSNPTAV